MKENYLTSLSALTEVVKKIGKSEAITENVETLEEGLPNMKGTPTGIKLVDTDDPDYGKGRRFEVMDKGQKIGYIVKGDKQIVADPVGGKRKMGISTIADAIKYIQANYKPIRLEDDPMYKPKKS